MSMYLQKEDKKKTFIDNHGFEKWKSMIEHLEDPDKILLTYSNILPNFLQAPIPITINLSAETQKRDTGPAKSANLKAIRFRATPHETPSGNFDFVDEIHIHVSSPNDPTLPKKEIARLAPVANGQTAIEPLMDVAHVASAVLYMASLPIEANVQFLTVMATKMPFIGRG